MKIKDKIESIIRKHKNGVCFLLGIKPGHFQVQDIQTMANYLTYKAGESHSEANGGVDTSFLGAIRDLPPEKKCERIMFEACAWKERGELRNMSLHDAISSPPIFSPRVEAALEKHRLQTYRKDFKSLCQKATEMAKQMDKISQILEDGRSKGMTEAEFTKKLSVEARKIGHIFSGANYHMKSALIYAVKSGYSVEEAGKAMNDVYLRRVKKIMLSLSAIDDVLTLNGRKSNLFKRAKREYTQWSKLINSSSKQPKRMNDYELA